jgi:hypothetical protein
MGSLSEIEHEDILASKLSMLEQQMYAECRDLLHALEERKNSEYLDAIWLACGCNPWYYISLLGVQDI